MKQNLPIVKNDSPSKTLVANHWVVFDSLTTKDFSESFKTQLSEKLSEKLCAVLAHQVSGSALIFSLQMGSAIYQINQNNSLLTKAFEITVKDSFAMAQVTLINVFAQTYPVTIAWSSSDFKNPLDIHTSELTHKHVNFYWCDDLPTENIIKNLKPIKTTPKSDKGYKFDVAYYLKVFPDVAIFFEFNDQASKETLDEIQKEVFKFRDTFQTVFVHDMTEHFGYKVISINHNTIDFETYTDKDFEKDLKHFEFLLKNINKNPRINGLAKITFQ